MECRLIKIIKRLKTLLPTVQSVSLSWSPGNAVATAVSTGGQASSRLARLACGNGLLLLSPRTTAQTELQPGTELDAVIIGPLVRSSL